MTDDEIQQRDLLPGWSASKWSGLGLFGAAIWAVGTAGGLICALTIVRGTGVLDPITCTFLALFALGLGQMSFSAWMLRMKEKKEVLAGYTTMAQGHYDVERRHSPTGVVMRRAGQPALTRQQWEQAMADVREFRQK